MADSDPLHSVLQEWQPPEPSGELDARVCAAFRGINARPGRKHFWTARVSIPVAALAALGVVAMVLMISFQPTERITSSTGAARLITKTNVKGFEPLPNVAAQIIKDQVDCCGGSPYCQCFVSSGYAEGCGGWVKAEQWFIVTYEIRFEERDGCCC